ncbi:MAG: hypothetical protein ACE5ER_01905 [Nitrospinaceae bacterium]
MSASGSPSPGNREARPLLSAAPVIRGIVLFWTLMLPIWPLQGTWLRLPAWAVFAVLVSLAAGVWIAWMALWRWRDPEEEGPGDGPL